MFVVTIDQRGSRRAGDLVEALLHRLAAQRYAVVRPFERTAGDEVQGVLDDPATVVALALALHRDGSWSTGVGVGPVREPLPRSTRAGQGPAFTLARDAVTVAKNRPTRLAVKGADPTAARRAQSALDLLAAIAARRTTRGWVAVDLATEGLSQSQIAERFGISKQAVSQRLHAADWHLELPGRELAAHVLSEADGRLEAS